MKRSGRVTLIVIALPAAVATWSGWVGLGKLTGFGMARPLPGIVDWEIDTSITLPIGVEAYAAFAMRMWLSKETPRKAQKFAAVSAIGSLLIGMCAQVAYHVCVAKGVTHAPTWVTAVVSSLPVVVLGMAATLYHLVSHEDHPDVVTVPSLGQLGQVTVPSLGHRDQQVSQPAGSVPVTVPLLGHPWDSGTPGQDQLSQRGTPLGHLGTERSTSVPSTLRLSQSVPAVWDDDCAGSRLTDHLRLVDGAGTGHLPAEVWWSGLAVPRWDTLGTGVPVTVPLLSQKDSDCPTTGTPIPHDGTSVPVTVPLLGHLGTPWDTRGTPVGQEDQEVSQYELPVGQEDQIRILRSDGKSIRQIADEIGISRSAVSRILKGEKT